ncbi:MAG TPA: site-specific DNA-methyltransferase [Caulobacteraceae bacterium]|jgi:DNA modification methylase|nr:site-specific DNA-methyltransferase [Caulobacteraceae bacterium]
MPPISAIRKLIETRENYTLLCGDVLEELNSLNAGSFRLVVSSPPYNIGKSYEKDSKRTLEEYIDWQTKVIAQLSKLVTRDGSVCWQVGSFVRDNEYLPLDIIFYRIFSDLGFHLRNRIIWKFNFGLNSDKRFSGRYETLLWFTKSKEYVFNLDPVRVPQIYPGKRHVGTKPKAGKLSGNPLGKNPSDYWEFSAERDFLENPVWNIPNVKANHPERTDHPCQFPIELAERCVLAFTKPGDQVLDPFVGAGSSLIAAQKHSRLGTGIDRDRAFLEIARSRLELFENGELPMRASGRPPQQPNPASKVAKMPEEWISPHPKSPEK